MKKKLLSLILALVVITACGVPAMATDVNTASASGLTIDQPSVAVRVGEASQLTANLYGYSPAPVTWSIADANVATIDSNGMVTGQGLGLTTATATTADGMTATCVVHVVIKGIDVSHYQNDRSPIDWGTVKASGIDFAFVKATEGTTYTDPNFIDNVTGASAAGLHTGAYHFLRAGDALQQAQYFLSTVKSYPLDYPLVCDVEANDLASLGKDNITALVITFCDTVRAAGYRPMIYLNLNWANNYVDMSKLSGYDLWFARYNHTPGYSGVDVWQYSSTTTVPGISGSVDGNYAYVNYSSVLKSDTVVPYAFGSNSTYTYKITTNLTTAPKAVSSNPNAVSVAFYQKVSGGYLYRITNMNSGTATITTTASDGSSTSFTATGTAKGVVSDTTSSFTMKPGATYQMKLTLVGGATATPVVTTGTPGVLQVVSTVKSGNSFYVKLKAVGTGSSGVYTTMPGQSAIRQFVVTVAGDTSTPTNPIPTNPTSSDTATGVLSDTTAPFTMQMGAAYQMKLTPVGGTAGSLSVTVGTPGIAQVVSVVKNGDSFYAKFKAIGTGQAGIYVALPGKSPVKQCVVNVA